jgi:hypothetical protein
MNDARTPVAKGAGGQRGARLGRAGAEGGQRQAGGRDA